MDVPVAVFKDHYKGYFNKHAMSVGLHAIHEVDKSFSFKTFFSGFILTFAIESKGEIRRS